MSAAQKREPRAFPLAAWRPRFLRWMARRFYRLPVRRKLQVLEAVICLALARIALFFVPFRILAARFGVLAGSGAPGGPVLSETQCAKAREIGWAVTRAARYTPFRAVCLPQAIAAKAMLSRRGIGSVMHFGVAKMADAPLAAHAWLDAGPVEVTGFPVGEGFVEVARFL
ncbi:MAG: lasso peptide biosynthesis B2 protein [Rhizomicrobium sp.]